MRHPDIKRTIYSTFIRLLIPLFILPGAFLPSLPAQQTGKVSFPEYGIEFTIPDGWVGQVMGEAFVMGHQTKPGFLMLSGQDAGSIEEMRATAAQGINDPANGLYLQPSGQLENLGDNGLGGEFSGSIGGQPVRSYLVGLISPHGNGVTVMSAVSTSLWSDEYKQLALQLAGGVRFSKVVAPPAAAQGGTLEEWKYRLGNTRLTFMESYNSIDYSDPNYTTGGGYSNKEVIDLCKQGYFHYAGSNFTGITGGPGVSGNAIGSGQGAGSWDIRQEANGNKVLVLKFHSGEVFEYTLSYPDGKMHLNNKRYYHTWTGENAPACN